jgi:hypothetical protein
VGADGGASRPAPAPRPAGCSFCSGVSAFGTFFMFLLGILIQNNYK